MAKEVKIKNPIAKDLRTPKFKSRVIPNKRRELMENIMKRFTKTFDILKDN